MSFDISPSLDLHKLAENRESVNLEFHLSRKLVEMASSQGIEARGVETYLIGVRFAGLWG
jgi:hypothetical protein